MTTEQRVAYRSVRGATVYVPESVVHQSRKHRIDGEVLYDTDRHVVVERLDKKVNAP